MSRPLSLKRGARVGVVASGFAVRAELLEAGVRRLRRMGYEVVVGEHVLSRDGYLAGTDEERLLDLRRMIADPELDAIWFARGGYGTARLLDGFPWSALRRNPKLLVGYSDLTALFNAVPRRCGLCCLYGPVVAELGSPQSFHPGSLRNLLAGKPLDLRIRRRQVLAPGRARGTLVGGNLEVLSRLIGTRYAPKFDGAVLFLEEIGEESYRVDRMLTHLRQAGVFRRVAAVLLGGFTVPRTGRDFPGDRSVDELFRENFCGLDVPVIQGLPAGHVSGKLTLPIGGRVEIRTDPGSLRLSPRP